MELVGEYDVAVPGGGASGGAAAVASTRAGGQTLLIERLGVLGRQMNVSGPSGFACAHMFSARCEQVIAGIMEESHARLLRDGHALPYIKPEFRAGYTVLLMSTVTGQAGGAAAALLRQDENHTAADGERRHETPGGPSEAGGVILYNTR